VAVAEAAVEEVCMVNAVPFTELTLRVLGFLLW
jgi:hypothetical protein